MSGIKQGAVIPVYNHGSTAEPIVAFFAERHIPVILVDDGSYLKTKAALAKIEKKYPDDVKRFPNRYPYPAWIRHR